jgi:ADP-heptose:LPS heptosyltransferase
VRVPRYIGDAVMQMALLRLLRQAGIGPLVVWGPKLTVNLVTGTDLAEATLPDVGKPAPWAMARLLRQHRAARSIHFPKSLRPALGAFIAGVPERLGVSESLAGLFNTHTGPFWTGATGHCLERYRHVLLKRWPDLPQVPFLDYQPPVSAEVPDRAYVCLMPGASVPAKAWPAAHYRALAEGLQARGILPVVLGGPSERELGAEVAGAHGLNRCGDPLTVAAVWMRGARAAVGNDSGLSHLAAGCGTPTLALYGPNDPGMFTPHGPQVAILQRQDLDCLPCGLDHCPIPGHPCLEGLGPEQVLAKLEPWLVQ